MNSHSILKKPIIRSPRLAAWLVAGGLLFGTCVVAATIAASWVAHKRIMTEASREARNTAFVLAHQTERAIQAVDLALEATIERGRAGGALENSAAFIAWAGTQAMHNSMKDRIVALPHLDGIILNGADGILAGTTRHWPSRRTNNIDHDYFQAQATAGASPYVAQPFRSRATGAWVIPVARRVEGNNGDFLGVAMGPIRSAYFESVYGTLALGAGKSISLIRNDGTVLARYPYLNNLIGTSIRDAPVFALSTQAQDGSAVQVRGQDGIERVTVGQSLASFPLRVQVGLSVEAALAPWYEGVRRLVAGAVMLLLVLAAAVAAAVRAVRTEARASEERVHLKGALAAQQEDFRQAVEGMSQAVWRFGPDGHMVLWNESGAKVVGLPPELALKLHGMTLDALQQAASAAGTHAVAELVGRVEHLVAAGDATSVLHDLPDERTLAINWRPMQDGGWLTTFEDVTERHAAEARARFLARHDALTGLPNRIGLQEHLAALLPRLASDGGRAAILYMDLDRFKEVNDTLGHPVGDLLLIAVVERIRRRLRGLRNGGDFVARLGGDEFAVVTAPAFDVARDAAADAARIATRLVTAIAEPFDIEGQRVVVGSSIGIALCPADGTTADALLRHADLALYRAKHEGRSRHCFYEVEMGAAAQTKREIETELRRALEAPDPPEFVVHYQPLVEVGTRTITGFEALLRWQHPVRGLIPPAEFIPVAEEIGLIDVLGALVLVRACREATTWPESVRVAVNVSALQFGRDGLVESVLSTLSGTGLVPERLELEITESALLRSTETTVAVLHRLRSVGVRIALDDFGTGYSSLSYLLAFPFDKIKVDRSFVGQAVMDANATAIIRAVSGLCTQLGVTMTAEGVETEEQFRMLVAEGCNEAQGYLLGRPMHASKLPDMLRLLGYGGGQTDKLAHLRALFNDRA